MNKTEAALKERIKELTCLYEVSSIIVNSSIEFLDDTLKAITLSLKKGFQYPEDTNISIKIDEKTISTSKLEVSNTVCLFANLKIFNKNKGEIYAYLDKNKFSEKDFLREEQQLLDNVALKLGNLLERIEIQKNEISLRNQMQHADRLSILGELTAGIAHELNTPLANILGFAELLKNDLKTNKEVVKDIDKIIENAIFSREVVKKLMFFACKMPQEMIEINLVPIIKNAINLLEATFKKEHIKYVINIKEESLLLKADSIQLTQIIFNLLMNAIYFSPKNSVVSISAHQTQKNIILKISDEGKGFTKNNLEKIFQPFFTTKPMGDGAGLGLSVVHGIIASHKGTISAENNKKNGAIFTITLPKN